MDSAYLEFCTTDEQRQRNPDPIAMSPGMADSYSAQRGIMGGNAS